MLAQRQVPRSRDARDNAAVDGAEAVAVDGRHRYRSVVARALIVRRSDPPLRCEAGKSVCGVTPGEEELLPRAQFERPAMAALPGALGNCGAVAAGAGRRTRGEL